MERNTTNISISLPKQMKEQVKRRVEEDNYGTPSDYLRSLIREDLRRRDQERLEQALLEGLDSGKGIEFGSNEWDDFDRRLKAIIGEKKKK